jgi:transcriptional regulator with XRE-family HTH domain
MSSAPTARALICEVAAGRQILMSVMYRGPVVIRRRLGSALRQLRAEKGYGLDVIAKKLEISPAKLSRLEAGHVAPKLRDIRDLLDEYGAPAHLRKELLKLADDAKDQGWWQPLPRAVNPDLNLYISLETEARTLRIFGTAVPALLQTETYARMVQAGVEPQKTAAEHEEIVKLRLRRQHLLKPDREHVDPLQLHAILDEAALRRGPATGPLMAEQMRGLVERAPWPNITVQVLPFSACFTPAWSVFSIFEPRDPSDWPVVCVERTGSETYYDSPLDIGRYEQIWQTLSAQAASPEETVSIIETAAHEWQHAPRA